MASLESALREAWDDDFVARGSENVRAYNEFTQTYKGMWAAMHPTEREVQARASRKPGMSTITMTAGKPDATLLPYDEIMAFAKKAWEQSIPAPLEYGASTLLRKEIAKYLSRTRGHTVEPNQILITAGNGPGLRSIMQGYLGPGDVAIVESPLWTITVNLMKVTGATVVSVGMDSDGISIDELEQQILSAERDGKRVKMIYVQPINHNPTGSTMSRGRAEQLLRLAAAHSIVIVSDEPYEMYCYHQQPCFLSQLSGGFGVLTVHTFSKTLGTGLRLGYIHSRPEWLEPVQAAGSSSSVFLEYAVGELMAAGRFEQIIARAKEVYANKLTTFCDALDTHVGRHLAVAPQRHGGFFVWIELARLPAFEVHLKMLALGVEARIGSNMHGPNHEENSHDGVEKMCHIGFAFIGPSEDELVEGARRIGAACDAVEAEISLQTSSAPSARL